MTIETVITIIVSAVSGGFITNVMTARSTARKGNNEATKGSIDNVVDAVNFYKEQFDYLTSTVGQLQTKVDGQSEQIKELTTTNVALTQKVAILTTRLKKCENCKLSNKYPGQSKNVPGITPEMSNENQ